MALSILSSNRVETLQENLCLRLGESLPADPFVEEIIVVPTYAMARWLNLQIALRQGIAANISYPLPASWVWQLAASILDQVPLQDPLQCEQTSWKIFNLLPGLLTGPAFAPLQRYMRGDDQAVKRWQLANRIATVFDRYQLYRPEMIRDWSAGGGDDWQAELWRALINDAPQNHRVVVLGQLIERLNSNLDAGPLPERVSLFAISSLPPLLIEVIHALAAHTEITLYQHSPTDQYWADLRNKKSLSRMRLENPQQAEYFDTGNDLLASWGRQGQALQDLLLDNDSLPASDWESYQAPGNSSLLQSIQQTIFELDSNADAVDVDDSLSIHICHSPMRECQVLHDQLLAMIDRDPSLHPEDILVMIPEISGYAPYIEAVFRSDERRPTLPWNLSDISLADEHPLVKTFLQLLKLPDSRFSHSEVMAYLDIDEIRNRFDIDDRALDDIHAILEVSRVRWGIDRNHKTALGLPPIEENTWHQAKQRIFAGYAFTEVEFWHEIAPIADVDGNRAQSLGKFWLLFESLQHWHEHLGTACSADEWQGRLNRMLDDFFKETGRHEGRLQQIRDAIDDLTLAEKATISPVLLLHWMEQQLSSQELHGRLFSGGVTFCGMRPMRSLPFRVICLLGMNDSAFPRRENHIEFDRMAGNWRPGDPTRGDQDRYLMLETLLCARQSLYISYSGRSLKDNSECQPSVLLRELLDFVDDECRQVPEASQSLSRRLTTRHPMQAFSANNYYPQARSYDSYWCEVANRMRQAMPPAGITHWPNQPLDGNPGEERIIKLDELRAFLTDPLKFFFNRRLKLWPGSQYDDEDEEPFNLDALEKWNIKQRIAVDLLQGHETTPGLLRAEGWLPHGHAAMASFEGIQIELVDLLAPLQEYAGVTSISPVIDCQLENDYRLVGQTVHYYPGKGLMHFNSSALKGKHLLALWIDHLALCACGQLHDQDSSLLVSRDHSSCFAALDPSDAAGLIVDYIGLYHEGLAYPLPVFPLASYAWASENDADKAAKAVSKAWHGDDYRGFPGDRDNPYVKLALRGCMPEPFLSAEFEACAQRLYAGALELVINT
jgi:exodeoxyribonuclease V gamma subunit